jgi:hypothetical protein
MVYCCEADITRDNTEVIFHCISLGIPLTWLKLLDVGFSPRKTGFIPRGSSSLSVSRYERLVVSL